MQNILAASPLREGITAIARNPRLNTGIVWMRTRQSEFATDLEMMLTGIAVVPEARDALDAWIERRWGSEPSPARADEVIVGSGPHAAVYAAARVAMGFPRPLVLEATARPGGSFAASRKPSFYLNSRNTPGPAGPPPGRQLNHLPGAPVQAVNICAGEYPTNADMAFVVRVTLAQNARVRQNFPVTYVASGDSGFSVEKGVGYGTSRAARVIDARGLGSPRQAGNGSTILTFADLMARMDQPFPFRGMQRVAVIGDGDSARCAVEALLGYGPPGAMTVPALDFVRSVDWYAPAMPSQCRSFRQQQRGRYLRLASALPDRRDSTSRESYRLRVVNSNGYVSAGLGGALVNDTFYDCAIVATGLCRSPLLGAFQSFTARPYGSATRTGSQYGRNELYAIGPAADIPFTGAEQDVFGDIPENVSSLFRLTPRTAALAVSLPAP